MLVGTGGSVVAGGGGVCVRVGDGVGLGGGLVSVGWKPSSAVGVGLGAAPHPLRRFTSTANRANATRPALLVNRMQWISPMVFGSPIVRFCAALDLVAE